MKYGKVWGETEPLLQTPFVEVHRIFIKAGGQCSFHAHKHKWNMFYVITGRLDIHVQKNNYALTDVTRLFANQFTTVSPTEKHFFEAITDVEALEIYYPEPLSEDILRESVGRIKGVAGNVRSE
jgi:mannose-6-phosphate isomerase-like protein (cupin superfamily)